MATWCFYILLALSLVACEIQPSGIADQGAATGHDASQGTLDADAAENCSAPNVRPDWLMPLLDDVVARLSGTRDITQGVRIADRGSAMSRGRVQVYLKTKLEALGYTVELQPFDGGTNVLAYLPGTSTTLYILGAHYDSRPGSPGANRNATGVAATLAAATYLIDQRCREHSVLFAFLDNQESALAGSRALASSLVAERENVLGIYLLRQLGWDMDGNRGMEAHRPSPGPLEALGASINRYSLDSVIAETSLAGHSHQVFQALGVPALVLTEETVAGDTSPFAGLTEDAFGTVDFDYLASCATVVFATLSDLSVGR